MPFVAALAAVEPHEAQKPAPCRGRSLLWCGLAAFALLLGAATVPARRVDRHLDALVVLRDGRSAPVVFHEWDDTAGDQAQVAIQARAIIDDDDILAAPSASSSGNYTAG